MTVGLRAWLLSTRGARELCVKMEAKLEEFGMQAAAEDSMEIVSTDFD